MLIGNSDMAAQDGAGENFTENKNIASMEYTKSSEVNEHGEPTCDTGTTNGSAYHYTFREALIKSGAHIAQNFFRQIVRKSRRVRVSGGYRCEAAAPTEAAAETILTCFKRFECNLTKKGKQDECQARWARFNQWFLSINVKIDGNNKIKEGNGDVIDNPDPILKNRRS